MDPPLIGSNGNSNTVTEAPLCAICSAQLTLDDADSGGVLKNEDGVSVLYFPHADSLRFITDSSHDMYDSVNTWKGGVIYERTVTPPNLPELSDSFACKLCLVLKRSLLDRYGDCLWWKNPSQPLQIEGRYQWYSPPETRKADKGPHFRLSALAITYSHPEMEETYHQTKPDKFPIMAEPGRCRDWLHIERAPIALQGPASEKFMPLIKKWIKECDSNQDCAEFREFPKNKANFLPTRLIYLGDGTTGQCPQIVETRDLLENRSEMAKQRLQYACLSYCWGSDLPLTTTSSTLSRYKSELPEHKMPQIFQDAIAVSRGLGMQYLWIDALCILQDVLEDWEREALMMSDVFYHSFITIGAATARSCHDSIFSPREDLSCTLSFRSSLSKEVIGSYCIHLSKMSLERPSEIDLSNSIWTSRGWVWQEQIMAQRLLVFGKNMVHLKCHGCIYSENGTVDDVFGSYVLRASRFQTSYISPDDWNMWMMDFSGRQFTFPRDKLASVSGLALAFERAMATQGQPSEYLAGHWRNEYFDGSLQWAIMPENKVPFHNMIKDLHDPEKYCAPSWSWVSRNQGQLITLSLPPDPRDTKADFEFISNNLVAAKSNVRVRTRPGSSVTLRGRVRPFACTPIENAEPYDMPDFVSGCAEWKASVPGGTIYYFLDWNPLLDDTSWEELKLSLRLFLLTDVGMGLILLSETKYEPGFLRVGAFLFMSSNGGMSRTPSITGPSWRRSSWICDNLRSDFLQTGWNVENVVLY
ncbi:hypothetical protein BELL_0020g00380 [Botrytis elliptica]|uniref:Heterokaryon incompatibility domain-containing protein n=1 Tax=Botrytis elliptica TaxID=278938 RepID=A0A4Z1K180_9HELO|nr:hypothetical protein EAE99_005113 [Botrytis elliptica]TGO79901.1 hypothetical protein BELL_0020g00380 [Botrytis elliptica]